MEQKWVAYSFNYPLVYNNYKLLIIFQQVDVYLMNQSKLMNLSISQLIKLATERRISTTKLVARSIAIKEEAKNVKLGSKKDTSKVKIYYSNEYCRTS